MVGGFHASTVTFGSVLYFLTNKHYLSMYVLQVGDGSGERETLQQKYQRLQHEMRELAEEVTQVKVGHSREFIVVIIHPLTEAIVGAHKRVPVEGKIINKGAQCLPHKFRPSDYRRRGMSQWPCQWS